MPLADVSSGSMIPLAAPNFLGSLPYDLRPLLESGILLCARVTTILHALLNRGLIGAAYPAWRNAFLDYRSETGFGSRDSFRASAATSAGVITAAGFRLLMAGSPRGLDRPLFVSKTQSDQMTQNIINAIDFQVGGTSHHCAT